MPLEIRNNPGHAQIYARVSTLLASPPYLVETYQTLELNAMTRL